VAAFVAQRWRPSVGPYWKGLTVMHIKQFLMIGLLAIATGVVMRSPTEAAEPDTSRKTTRKVAPVYPAVARRMQLRGTVRIAALVAPDGQVKNTEVIGGHPILAAAAHDAVMAWKFEVATRESREELVFAFAP
jgi:TonB family protein